MFVCRHYGPKALKLIATHYYETPFSVWTMHISALNKVAPPLWSDHQVVTFETQPQLLNPFDKLSSRIFTRFSNDWFFKLF
jgi:hypothetical protein